MNRRHFTAALALLASGCLHRPSTTLLGASGQPPPPEPAACSRLRATHNGELIVGALDAGLAGGGGSLVAVETDQGQKIGTVAGSAVLGVGAALFTVLAGISADDYTQQCTASK